MAVTDSGVPLYVTSADMTAAAPIGAAPGAGLFSRLLQVTISVGAALEIFLQEETSGDIKYSFLMAANSTVTINPAFGNELPVANKRWMARASGAGQVRITAVTEVV